MSTADADRPLILVDADVLGRRRTGDETFVRSLLGALPEVAGDVRLGAVTRRPELVPSGVQALTVPARSQLLRLGLRVPRLSRLYREADCLLFPSRFEGFGFPVLEAMASGTPVVCSDEPALRETAGDAAVVAVDGNFAGAVEQARSERERLPAAGIERARRFTWRETALRTMALYREVIAS